MPSSCSKMKANEPLRNHQPCTVKTTVWLTSLQSHRILNFRTPATLLSFIRYPLSICLRCCTPHIVRNRSLPSRDYQMWARSNSQDWRAALQAYTSANHNWKRAQEHTGKAITVSNKLALTIVSSCTRNQQQQLNTCSQLMAMCTSKQRSSSWLKCTISENRCRSSRPKPRTWRSNRKCYRN